MPLPFFVQASLFCSLSFEGANMTNFPEKPKFDPNFLETLYRVSRKLGTRMKLKSNNKGIILKTTFEAMDEVIAEVTSKYMKDVENYYRESSVAPSLEKSREIMSDYGQRMIKLHSELDQQVPLYKRKLGRPRKSQTSEMSKPWPEFDAMLERHERKANKVSETSESNVIRHGHEPVTNWADPEIQTSRNPAGNPDSADSEQSQSE